MELALENTKLVLWKYCAKDLKTAIAANFYTHLLDLVKLK